MIKYYFKCTIAFLFVIVGMWIIFDLPNFLTHKYVIERLVLGSCMILFGGYYYNIIEGRMEKTNGRRC